MTVCGLAAQCPVRRSAVGFVCFFFFPFTISYLNAGNAKYDYIHGRLTHLNGRIVLVSVDRVFLANTRAAKTFSAAA